MTPAIYTSQDGFSSINPCPINFLDNNEQMF
jgi:hypothetical protein